MYIKGAGTRPRHVTNFMTLYIFHGPLALNNDQMLKAADVLEDLALTSLALTPFSVTIPRTAEATDGPGKHQNAFSD